MQLSNLDPLTIILMFNGLLFYILGWIQVIFPPKKINPLYGYRTKRSMRNIATWKFAQLYSSKKMREKGVCFLLFCIAAYFLELDATIGIWIGILTSIVFPIVLLIEVEKALKKNFPKE